MFQTTFIVLASLTPAQRIEKAKKLFRQSSMVSCNEMEATEGREQNGVVEMLVVCNNEDHAHYELQGL